MPTNNNIADSENRQSPNPTANGKDPNPGQNGAPRPPDAALNILVYLSRRAAEDPTRFVARVLDDLRFIAAIRAVTRRDLPTVDRWYARLVIDNVLDVGVLRAKVEAGLDQAPPERQPTDSDAPPLPTWGNEQENADALENLRALAQERDGGEMPPEIGGATGEPPPPPPVDPQDPGPEGDPIPPQGNSTEPPPPQTVEISTNLTTMVNTAESIIGAVRNSMSPAVYQRMGMITHIIRGAKMPKWLLRDPSAPTSVEAGSAYLRELATRNVTWLRRDNRKKGGEQLVAALPPKDFIQGLIERKQWDLPHLEGIVSAPTLLPNGELLTAPGYHPDSGLYLDTLGVVFPPIPVRPTRDDALRALASLWECFRDFPLLSKRDRSATFAALFTIMGRFVFANGRTPLFLATGNTPGAGKGLLINTVCQIATGRIAPCWPQVYDNDDEERKRYLTVAVSGDLVCHIDNINKPFGSAPLATLITTGLLKDRILGKTEATEQTVNTVLFGSGNNVTLTEDMLRRVVPIYLESKLENPTARTDLTHDDLLDWISKNRARLVVDALTVLRAYIVADRPETSGVAPLGSFEQWSRFVRHLLLWLDEEDPYTSAENIAAESDANYPKMLTLFDCWTRCYPDGKARTLAQVCIDITTKQRAIVNDMFPPNEWNAFFVALSAFDEKFDGRRLDTTRISYAMRAFKKRIFEGRWLVSDGVYRGSALWRVETVNRRPDRDDSRDTGNDLDDMGQQEDPSENA